MTILPIVEGHYEVEAVGVLLRRLRDQSGEFGIQVGKAIRRKRSEMVQQDPLRKAVRLALLQPSCDAILIMFDADNDCPAVLAPMVDRWARDEAGAIPVAVVMPCREFEAWFLASMESLRGCRGILTTAEPHPDPEYPRHAKAQLDDRMEAGRSYSETADQAALTAQFDMTASYARCRSFRKMARAFGVLINSATGRAISGWPPAAWAAEE